MKTLLSVLLLIAGFAILYDAVTELNGKGDLSSIDKPSSVLAGQIQKDLLGLAAAKELPPEWTSIRESTASTTSPLTEQWLKDTQVQIPTTPSGKYRLEYVLIAENPNDQKSRVLIQYGLYDIQSQNKVWEKIRIYNR